MTLRLQNLFIACLALAWSVEQSGPVMAQGVLWQLPANGSWVRFEGECTQVVPRPNKVGEDLNLKWQKQVVMKSLSTEEAEYRDEKQPCRWLEFKITTGTVVDGTLQAGPGSEVLYKILVPEAAIHGEVTEISETAVGKSEVFVSFIPIVKGFRKVGEEEPLALPAGVFQAYPILALVQHYREYTEAGEEMVELPTGSVSAKKMQGSSVQESPSVRSANTGTLWRSETAPFGLAKWSGKTVTAEKNAVLPRSKFEITSTMTEEMTLAEIGTEAESELMTP